MKEAGNRLLQFGMFLFLIGLLTGFVIPHLVKLRMGLVSHLEGIMNGIFLVLLGLLWPKINLSRFWLATTFWLSIYGTFANWLQPSWQLSGGPGLQCPSLQSDIREPPPRRP